MNIMDTTTRTITDQSRPGGERSSKGADRPRAQVGDRGFERDTLVITLHEALSPAEKALAKSPEGAAQVQEFHRQLFLNSADSLRKEIKRITGREVREAAAEVEPASGTVVHAFTTGTMVQVFLLAENGPAEIFERSDAAPSA